MSQPDQNGEYQPWNRICVYCGQPLGIGTHTCRQMNPHLPPIMNPAFLQQPRLGWICPKCNKVYSPDFSTCPPCNGITASG